MKKAVCLQHVPFEGPGTFGPVLQDMGFELDSYLVPEQELPQDPGDMLLVMGGPMSVNDPLPWLKGELDFIQQSVRAGVPYLGICLGSQLLAKAMGGRVTPGPIPEIGPGDVQLTRAGREDLLLNSLPETLGVLQWHGEGIQAPPGAVILADSAHYPTQAFRVGKYAYGLLFHLEMNPVSLEAICKNCPEDLARVNKSVEELCSDAGPYFETWANGAETIIRRLVEKQA
jgi:GMP synthase-like glutamine amidotransferase